MNMQLDEMLEEARTQRDEKILSLLALEGPTWMIRKEAVKNPNLRNESIFENVLLNEKDDYVCFYAYGKLRLINPNSKLILKLKDVMEIDDESRLIDIIKSSIYKAPSVAGGRRIDRCKVYPYLVCPDKRWKVRYYAVANKNLKNQRVLTDVALNDYDLRVRCAAISNPNLNDEDLFCYLALNDCKYSVRCDAAARIQNESVLMQIIENDSMSCVRVHAISNPNLSDQSFLTYLAFGDYDYNVRRQAVLKIKDDNVLKEIFKRDNHGEVKKAVCRCISDVSFLNKIVDGRYKWKLKVQAYSRLRELEKNHPQEQPDIDKSSLLCQFQQMNTTCESIYDLGNLDVLIILEDGTNLTDWKDVSNRNDVLFVSENLKNQVDLAERYKDLSGMKAIVATEISDKATSLEDMFFGCFSLTDISSLKNWDVSGICNMNGLFKECNSLVDLSPLMHWDVSNVTAMKSMFENCFSLGSVSPLRYWATGNVSDMSHMFDDCHSLEDLSGLFNWNVENVENMEYMFSCCNYLENLYCLRNWDISNVDDMAHMFDGCDYLKDISDLCYWQLDKVGNKEAMFSNCGIDEKFILKLFEEKDNEKLPDLKSRNVPLE